MSTVLTKSPSAKVHNKRPYSDHSVEVGQLIPRFILSLSRLGKRRSTSWLERFRRVASGVESNVGAPTAIYERGDRDDWIVLERSRAILVRRRTTIDSFGSVVIPGCREFNTAPRQFRGKRKFRKVSERVTCSGLQ